MNYIITNEGKEERMSQTKTFQKGHIKDKNSPPFFIMYVNLFFYFLLTVNFYNFAELFFGNKEG